MIVRDRGPQECFPSVAAEAWVSLAVAADHLMRPAEAVCARHGITNDQYNVLRILRSARPAGLSRGEITRRLLRRAPDTTRLLDRLERAGLARRARGATDARTSVARITKAGLALLARIDPDIEQTMASATARLRPAQLRQLVHLCNTLVK